jgi:hypothetical protein
MHELFLLIKGVAHETDCFFSFWNDRFSPAYVSRLNVLYFLDVPPMQKNSLCTVLLSVNAKQSWPNVLVNVVTVVDFSFLLMSQPGL